MLYLKIRKYCEFLQNITQFKSSSNHLFCFTALGCVCNLFYFVNVVRTCATMLLANVKKQRKSPARQKRSGLKDQKVRLPGFVYRARLAENLTQYHTINWDSAQCLNYNKNMFDNWTWKAAIPVQDKRIKTDVNSYWQFSNEFLLTWEKRAT